ncbi:3-phosphoserine/phosphohydroxythreonine transaminase [Cytobacillus suaedae]|nr:3-phosphoserine/phosphohydroxythreonine transaminase [Cytobacillus suaedae]
MKQIHNFNAGPSALPKEVLKEAQAQLLNFNNTRMSIMELSHRSKEYEGVHEQAKSLLKELLGISDEYEVLFLQGGASLQFSMVPLNLLTEDSVASYVLTGAWSEKAYKEASKIGETSIVASTKDSHYTSIPTFPTFNLPKNSSYLHITSNNTIYGTQFQSFPETGQIPLIADMSSDLMSKKINIESFSLIYAGAQKNLGPAGVTVVIIKKDLLRAIPDSIPTILNYSTHVKNNSLYNTPPTFSIYLLSLVLKWIKEQGGVNLIEERNSKIATLLYRSIDDSDGFYIPHATKDSRSNMNITFKLPTEELTNKFLTQAAEDGFIGLKGHRSIGGCRASIYNAVSYESCEAFSDFMSKFRILNF